MKEKRLLYAVGWVKDSYIEEMNQPGRTKAALPRRKFWLIAAIVALMLLLVGCVSVYLWMQERSIGQKTYTQRFDAQGHYAEPTEKILDTVTLFGSGGSRMQKALSEWLEFKINYPDSWDLNLTEADFAKVPKQYRDTYDCYTPEMVEKLKQIAREYDLKLLGAELSIQRYQYETALEGLGLTSLLRPEAKATMENGQGSIRLPQNFDMEFFVELTGREEAWAKDILVNYAYGQADFFPGFGTVTLDLGEFRQWQYQAADGTPLLLALNQKGKGIILAEREDAMIYLEADSNLTGPNFPKPEEVMDQKGLEQLADAFDYSITPNAVDVETLQPKLNADYAADQQRMLDSIATYGGFTDYLLENAHTFPRWYYSFYDLDGDGSDEMLLGGTGTGFSRCCVLHEGEVYERIWLANMQPLQNGGLLQREMETISPNRSGQTSYVFYEPHPNGAAMIFDFSGQGSGGKGELAVGLIFENGVWKKYHSMQRGDTIISEEEARAIIDQYPIIDLSWKPVWDYPVDAEGTTLGQVLSERKNPVTWEESRDFYAAAVEDRDIALGANYTHFALRDINRDGVMELIVSPDGEQIWLTYTCRYGKAAYWTSTFNYLCEGDIFLRYGISSAEDGADLETYGYYTSAEFNLVAEIQCNKASGQWTDLVTGNPITAEEAEAILAQYPVVPLDMHPIEELLS